MKPVRIVGILSIIAGLVLVITGGVVWGVVTSQLAAEKITVAKDSPMLAGASVTGPFSAYAEAEIINEHAMKASEGRTYAQLGADIAAAKAEGNNDEVTKLTAMRTTAMNASFLRASLFTSVLSYGVCAMAIGMGVVIGAVGYALTRVAALVPVPAVSKAAAGGDE